MRKQSREMVSDDCPEFFKIYLPGVCSENLRIPPAFVKHFEGDVPQMTSVESSAGSWQVKVTEINEDLFFQEGWKKFAQENSLAYGDFLTFSYVSKFKFYVKIYGKNSCRKKFPFTAESDDEVQILQGDQTIETGTFNTPQCAQKTLGAKTPVGFKKTDQPPQQVDELTRVSPTFKMMITPTYFSRFLNVPSSFNTTCRRCSATSGGNATLRIGEGSWSVEVVKCKDRYKFFKGWDKFVADNSVQIGDICNFNLINRKKFVLEVSISR